jgi:diaminopimelate decarboxylase
MMPDKTTQEMLRAISANLSAADIDLAALKAHLVGLLTHLASQEGRTDENCKAVDSFFCLDDTWPEKELPVDFHDLLADMGGALHDTVESPEIAENFDSTPEQLLHRARRLGTEPTAAGYSRSARNPKP